MGSMAMDWTAAMRAQQRPFVDFASVPVSQWKMHDRLENWSRWARGGSGEMSRTSNTAPGFELYRSSEVQARRYGEEISVPIDKDDAIKVAKAVGHLPPQKRKAIHWNYLNGRNPSGQARDMGVELAQLAQLVIDARTMLLGWV